MSSLSPVSSDHEGYDFRPRKRRRLRKLNEFTPPKILQDVEAEEVVGRTREVRQVLNMIAQPDEGMRPLLIGPRGVGKHAIITKVVTALKNSPLQRRKIVCLNCNELIAQTPEEERKRCFQTLAECVLEKPKNILYLRHVEKVLEMEYLHSLFTHKIPFLATIDGQLTGDEEKKATAFLAKYSFVPIQIKESPVDEVKEIVNEYFSTSMVEVTADVIDVAIRLAGKYENRRPFPIKAIQLIQACLTKQFLNGKIGVLKADEVISYIAERVTVPEEDLKEESLFNEKRFIEKVQERIVGQDHAIKMMAERIGSQKLGLLDQSRPWGVFLFVGPTGVGKTELAKATAEMLFNSKEKMIYIDGSEYMEEHSGCNLIGAPIGYEGHSTGGLLTEPLLKDPHQVVLFDEFEKAHPNVQKLFLQVFDRGTLQDRRGKKVDCTQTLFIMTSNVGSRELFSLAQEKKLNAEGVLEELKPLLVDAFSPEMCNRFTAIVPFQPLNKKLLPKVAEVQLKRISKRLEQQAKLELSWTRQLVKNFAKTAVDLSDGMRGFCRKIDEVVISLIKEAATLEEVRLSGKLRLNVKDEEYILEY